MEKIVIYGKGGIGKTTIANNIAVAFAQRGMKVLYIGCDPKGDCSLKLVDTSKTFKTLMEILLEKGERLSPEDMIIKGCHGIDCIESGGPAPGVGCAGRGIAIMMEEIEKHRIISGGEYDVLTELVRFYCKAAQTLHINIVGE